MARGLWAFLAAAAALAAAPEPAPAWRPFGGLRLALVYDDQGYERDEGYEPPKTARFESAVLLGASGTAGERMSFRVALQPLAKTLAHQAYVDLAVLPGLRLRVGRDVVHQGGVANLARDLDTVVPPPYAAHQPFRARKDVRDDAELLPYSAPLVEALYGDPAGTYASLQALDDVVMGQDEAAHYNTDPKQPAVLAQGAVKLGDAPVRPLLQVATYDLNHSWLAALGATLAGGAWRGYAGVTLDTRRHTELPERANVADVYRAADLALTRAFDGWEAGATLGWLDVKEAEERRENSPGVVVDDDEVVYGAYARLLLERGSYRPFLAVTRRSGRFADATGGEVKEKSDTQARLGVTAGF